MTEYFVPFGYGESEIIEKHSRFLGKVWRVETEEEALDKLRQCRNLYRDATHNVYAYHIRENGIMRYSDDGEPQGTSGIPTLNIFRSHEIVNFCCVITRYFGGTLLGTGGLARAYSLAASLALENAGIGLVKLWKLFLLDCPYSMLEKVKNEAVSFGAIIENIEYGADVLFTLLVPEEKTDAFLFRLTDISSGTLSPLFCEETFRCVKYSAPHVNF